MSSNVTLPEGPLCVGQFYEITSDFNGMGTVQWVATATPDGVDPSDVTFLGGQSTTALVSVPVEGNYAFAIECCEVV